MGYANPIFLRAIPFSKSIQIPFWLGVMCGYGLLTRGRRSGEVGRRFWDNYCFEKLRNYCPYLVDLHYYC